MCVTPSPESTTTPVVKPGRAYCKKYDKTDEGARQRRTLGIQRQYSLDSNIHATKSILFEHDLTHPLPVYFRIHRWLCQQDLATRGVDLQFLIERVIPEMVHVLPVSDDTVFHGLSNLQVVAVFSGFVTDHDILDHCIPDTLFCAQDRATDDRWEG